MNYSSNITYDNWQQADNTTHLFARGFTGHEHLDKLGLINMNGRLYDPRLARFLSPDSYVQAPDNSQNFNRYSYCLNNPMKYTDPNGEWIHIVVGAIVGGAINLATNWDNCNGFWEYAAAFGAGAGSGAMTAGVGVLGALAGGALTGATNSLIAQTGKNFSGPIDWRQVGFNSVVGGVSGIVGFGAGKWAAKGLGGVVINGFKVNSPILQGAIGGTIGGAGGGYASGFTGGLLMTGNVGEANKAGMYGIWSGAAIGFGTGSIAAYKQCVKNDINPWTGKHNNSVTIGEGMRSNPSKGWFGIDKIAKDLGSDKFEPENLPIEQWYSDKALMNENAVWIETQMKLNRVIYDRGSVGNNSQYYNMEVGRTMDYNNIYNVKTIYNNSQTIRILIIYK